MHTSCKLYFKRDTVLQLRTSNSLVDCHLPCPPLTERRMEGEFVSQHHHHGGPSVSRMTLSVPLICGYGSGSAGRSWTCRAVRSLGTGSSHLSLGYRLPSGGVLWRTVLDGDALPSTSLFPSNVLSASHGRICQDCFTCCHTETEAAYQICCLIR